MVWIYNKLELDIALTSELNEDQNESEEHFVPSFGKSKSHSNILGLTVHTNLSRDARKTVFWVSDHARHKPACTVKEDG